MQLTQADVLNIDRELCQRHFWYYRQYIHKKVNNKELISGWFQRAVEEKLQKFGDDLLAGLAPMLVFQAPPQHGKSDMVVDFISWIYGKAPHLRTIYASFSERLGVRANLRLQRVLGSAHYTNIFPDTRIASKASKTDAKYLRNKDVFEIVENEGSFRNTTVLGSITGEGLDLGVVDDPIKGREKAESKGNRDKTWDWFTDDFFTRFSEQAGLLCILTRWHKDDPIGRLKELSPELEICSFPAIAEEGVELSPLDKRKPDSGAALFPELKSREFLMKRKLLMPKYSWMSLYQQTPTGKAGKMFDITQFEIVEAIPKLSRVARYWDKAGTQDAGCNTAGIKMGLTQDGQFIVLDAKVAQLGATKREKLIKLTAMLDGGMCQVYIEQEPGSGGKESAENTIRNLRGYAVFADRVTGSKEVRAGPYSAQVGAGNVLLLKAPWNKMFIEEHQTFPDGAKDQVDAAAGAFNKIALGSQYDIDKMTKD